MNTIEIKGKLNTALCYAKVVEDEAIDQIRRMCDYPISEGSKIRIMPDVHAGKGCTIGTTMTITDKVVPNVVGVDIGCGMYTVNLGKQDIDLERLDAEAFLIPSGRNVWEGRKERFDLTELRCYRELKDTKRLERSLGTLGGGNHFIEVDRASDGTQYLVIHSGSRNLGKQVAEIYQTLAVDLNKGVGEYLEAREELIKSYKAKGRRKEIQAALKELYQKKYHEGPMTIPADLCHLSGRYMEDYLHDVEICQRFARRNREKMAEILLEKTGLAVGESFHTIHNYIDTDEMILRKGSIAAHKGEKVLIPINMRDGSVIAVGKGNPEWNYSAPHGAGRIMSRTSAKNTISMEEYEESMKGIFTSSVCAATIDEAPMAYKSLDDIIDVINESVDIIDVMKPIYNFKAKD
ncbi:RNA-splicing ligase RtcB, repairs tRNA damage [Lachnospiraceae bacterium KH1T2]|nr:RNA-splicing ligase RtcB, repairs tRNA damage [Lachnospiraceae bacterium KH1T2]